MDYIIPLINFFIIIYLGIISIETILIIKNIDHTLFEAVVRSRDNIIKHITVKSNNV